MHSLSITRGAEKHKSMFSWDQRTRRSIVENKDLRVKSEN